MALPLRPTPERAQRHSRRRRLPPIFQIRILLSKTGAAIMAGFVAEGVADANLPLASRLK